jgi:hypothetical protein
VDLLAPGVNITSTWSTSDSATNTYTGTSMATPHVAGVAALYLEQAPGASSATVHGAVVSGSIANTLDLHDGLGTPNRLVYSRIAPVGTTAPQTSIDSGPSGTISSGSLSVAFSSSEAASSFECSLDGPRVVTGSYASCSSPKRYAGLADGSYTVSVRATNPTGNADATAATRSFTVDTSVPNCGGGPASTNPGAAALKLTMSVGRGKLAAILAKGLRVTTTCSARCDVNVQVRLDRKTAKRLKLNGRVGTATSSAPNRLTIKFNAKVRKALKRLHRVTLKILLTARDAKGDATSSIKRTLTLKR